MKDDVSAAVDSGCVFCGIVAGVVPAHVVWANDSAIAFLDRAPATEGHVLVVPRRHARGLLDASPDQAG